MEEKLNLKYKELNNFRYVITYVNNFQNDIVKG